MQYTEKVARIGEELVGLTLAEAASLRTYLHQEHEVRCRWLEPRVVYGGTRSYPDNGGTTPPKNETSLVDVMLVKVADATNKIRVIKAVRELTGLGLKDAKDLVDSLDKAPKAVKVSVLQDDAWAIKKKLETEGATVELK